jgi:hypothetical protein
MISTASCSSLCSASFLAATLLALPVRAAEPTSPAGEQPAAAEAALRPPSGGRVLNGHAFMPAGDVPGALVATSFESGLLVGIGSAHASWTVRDQTLSGTFEYAGVGAVLGYEYAVMDNLSLRLGLTELIYSGISGRSAVVIGSTLQGGAGAGATFSLPIGDSLRVGARFDASYAPKLGLTLGSAIRSVVDSCQTPEGCNVDSASAFEQKNVLQLQPALAASWAPLPALGLTANVAYIYADQTVNGSKSSGNALSLGVAADFDFRAISPVPIGLQAQFTWTAPSGSGSGMQHVTDLGGGIFYTGRKDLALGLQLIARRFAVTPDVDVTWSTFLSQIGMRYYW